MPASLLPLLLLNIIAYGITPGPANIYSMSCSLKWGRSRALRMWWGLLTGAVIDLTIVTLVCWALGEAMGGWVHYVKYVGAAYILWLAWKIFKTRGTQTADAAQCSFLSGLLMQLTNAKIVVFEFMAFGTFVLPYGHDLASMATVAPLFLLAGPGCNFIWIMAGHFLRKRIYDHHMRTVDTIFALALAACAVLILLQ